MMCRGELEQGGHEGKHARCHQCGALFEGEQGAWRPVAGQQPGVANHELAAQLGFAPQETGFERERREDPGVATHEEIGGVAVKIDDHGMHVDEERMRSRMEHRVEQKISQFKFGIVFSLVFIVVFIGLFVGVGWYVYKQVASASADRAGTTAEAKAAAWDGQTPFKCGGNDNVRLEGIKATFADGVAITAGGNCQLTLVNLEIEAPTAIKAGGNTVVTIEGGRIEGTTTAIDAGAKAKIIGAGVELTGKTKKKGLASIEIK
jgi:cbb3-type cytochrome oxidase subunit 3